MEKKLSQNFKMFNRLVSSLISNLFPFRDKIQHIDKKQLFKEIVMSFNHTFFRIKPEFLNNWTKIINKRSNNRVLCPDLENLDFQ
ncbi:hypothetical protein BpHYR1_028732 [Brachionus plicatilis]|uniref:Uncharacterized protein n=1 Tax=Brachionus plicatilis TaxID=10195 RepID=A0A3M7PKG6_BRAPC|nr:hypothetical protein BpHYR1_028732 [Brachionus plicatilis]